MLGLSLLVPNVGVEVMAGLPPPWLLPWCPDSQSSGAAGQSGLQRGLAGRDAAPRWPSDSASLSVTPLSPVKGNFTFFVNRKSRCEYLFLDSSVRHVLAWSLALGKSWITFVNIEMNGPSPCGYPGQPGLTPTLCVCSLRRTPTPSSWPWTQTGR